jgi:transcription elongation GreA/GreB family factor
MRAASPVNSTRPWPLVSISNVSWCCRILVPVSESAYINKMSRAFVKETDAVEELPEKLVSEHRNLVTPEGLALIEAEVERLQDELAEAQRASDRDAIQRASRDLRYWKQRLGSAEVQNSPTNASVVSFGSTVTLERDDGRIQKFRIVGEDESNPSKGKISYASPLAQALMEKSVGDVVTAGANEAEIVRIE